MENTNEKKSHGLQSDHLDEQGRRTSEQGSILDSEDDLFLGTDAQAFSSSRKSVFSSDGSDSVFTGLHSDSANESPRDPGTCRVIKKLASVGRIDSSDSLGSGLSDCSRNSHEVISLLNAMTVDPEEFLAGLGFAEPDMRTRIPDRFLQGPSKALGIDVNLFRRSLDQDDLYASPSQDSPVWSDSGSCRIPLRFITSPKESVSPVLDEGHNPVPLISEPEEAAEDSFDLMRHLRLNKPCHVTKGMFLEPVTEELEVSSVGSGTVRTRISRRLSNEEGTIIVREESLEQANLESELLLSLPAVENAEKGTESTTVSRSLCNEQRTIMVPETSLEHDNEESGLFFGEPVVENGEEGMESNQFSESKVSGNPVEDGSLIFVTVEGDEDIAVKGNSEKSPENNALNSFDNSAEMIECVTCVADVMTKEGDETPASLEHLRVASVVVQDSFELEEISTNEDLIEKGLSSTDPEAVLNVTSMRKQLTRENSGESSGFEEMILDKETLSPSSISPTSSVERFYANNSADNVRIPLAALLDPEMVVVANEKVGKGEKSPRATFAQRRTRSLTKQRPIDEDTIPSYAFFPISSAPFDLTGTGGSLGTKLSRDVLWSGANTNYVKSKSNSDVLNSTSDDNATDQNSNVVLNSVQEKPAAQDNECRVQETDSLLEDSSGHEFVNEKEPSCAEECKYNAISPSELRSSEIIGGEETSLTEGNISELNNSENNADINLSDYTNLRTEGSFAAHGCKNDLPIPRGISEIDMDSDRPSDRLTGKNLVVSFAQKEQAESGGTCAEETPKEEVQNPSQKIVCLYEQHHLHEINALEQSIEKYESTLSSGGPLDALKTIYSTKNVIARITEEMNGIQELRSQINNELERMKQLLAERRSMLLAGTMRDAVESSVTQKMADLLREQSSLNIGLSNISDELSIRRKASGRARIYAHIESAKRELKEEREKCIREFREEIKDGLVRELSERFLGEIEVLRREVRRTDLIFWGMILGNHHGGEAGKKIGAR